MSRRERGKLSSGDRSGQVRAPRGLVRGEDTRFCRDHWDVYGTPQIHKTRPHRSPPEQEVRVERGLVEGVPDVHNVTRRRAL
jgi:hypothetical protein